MSLQRTLIFISRHRRRFILRTATSSPTRPSVIFSKTRALTLSTRGRMSAGGMPSHLRASKHLAHAQEHDLSLRVLHPEVRAYLTYLPVRANERRERYAGNLQPCARASRRRKPVF